jgi:hypothetical protein
MNGYVESDAKVQARWNSRKQRDEAILTARANHTACLLAETMKDCENCKFSTAIEVEPWNEIPDSDTTPKYTPDMALPGYAFNSRRFEYENKAREELHKAYNKLLK